MKIHLPAVRITIAPNKTRVFEGFAHFDAAIAAIAFYKNTTTSEAYNLYVNRLDDAIEKELMLEDGFTLNNADFISREQAAVIACDQSSAVSRILKKEKRDWLDGMDLDLIPL